MTTIIIEDEKPAARQLQRMLNKLGIAVEALLYSVEEAINYLKEHSHPDLIFSDIQLSDGLSFEIFDTTDLKASIIFTTAYDEYALKAFKVNSVDYLLKPIDEEDLKAAIEKYKSRQLHTLDLKALKAILSPNSPQMTYKTRFTSKVGDHLKLFSTEEIACFFSENKGTYLKTTRDRNYLLETTLTNLERELNPDLFFRINRKYIVRLSAIQDIIQYTNSRLRLILENTKEADLIVARERVRDFKMWLEQ